MKDPAQKVSICAGRHRFEEVATDGLQATMGDRIRYHMRLIEENAFRRGRGVQNRGHLCADAATDIGDHWEPAPVAGGSHDRCHRLTYRTHHLVIGLIGSWMLSEKFPEIVAVNIVERRLSGSH